MRKGEIACNKQFLLSSQCFLPYWALIFHFKCTLKCRLQFVSIWNQSKILLSGNRLKSSKKPYKDQKGQFCYCPWLDNFRWWDRNKKNLSKALSKGENIIYLFIIFTAQSQPLITLRKKPFKNNVEKKQILGPYSPTILKNILCLCLQDLQIWM